MDKIMDNNYCYIVERGESIKSIIIKDQLYRKIIDKNSIGKGR